MVKVEVEEATGIGFINPTGTLSEADFEMIRDVIDAYLDEKGELNGLIIHTPHFPGWESFRALTSHMYFIKDYQARVARVALVSDSSLKGLAQTLGKHFVTAEVKVFNYPELEQAKQWIMSST